jgi:hypothetical protein
LPENNDRFLTSNWKNVVTLVPMSICLFVFLVLTM